MKKKDNINIIIPMAGLGTRMGENTPKPLIKFNGKYMIESVIDNLLNNKSADLKFNFIFCVLKDHVLNHGINNILKRILSKYHLKHKLVIIDKLTKGPASTCLLAKKYINKLPLIIINSDQIILDFDINKLVMFSKIYNPDAILGIFLSNNQKNSYVKLNDYFKASQVKEKEVISNYATNGLHYWKNGLDFVKSAEKMIKNNDTVNNEFYIAPTFNYLIKQGKKVSPYFYNLHFPIGTKEDLDYYTKICANI